MEQIESAVGLLGALVKCLSGIRRGDHNRVRLAQTEKRLALRSQLVAMELEIYQKEKAAQEESERKERAAERRRKQSPLSEHGKIDLLRGKLFGPDLVVAERERVLEEREKETKRLQKELEILKEKMPKSRRAEGVGGSQKEEGRMQKSEDGAVGSPMSDVAPASGTVPSGVESIRVHASACDQLEGKGKIEDGGSEDGKDGSQKAEGAGGSQKEEGRRVSQTCRRWFPEVQKCAVAQSGQKGEGGGSKIDPPSPSFGATSDGKDAAKDLDPVETERELARIGKGLEALAAGEQVEFDLVAAERDQERIGKGIKVLLARQEAARII